MESSIPTRTKATTSRLPVPVSRTGSSHEHSRKDELVGSLRARINALEDENRILQSENEKFAKRCKELKDRNTSLSSSRKTLMEQLSNYKNQSNVSTQQQSSTDTSINQPCTQCSDLELQLSQAQAKCKSLQDQVDNLAAELSRQSVVIPTTNPEDYTQEVIGAMLGQMVERTACKIYKGTIIQLREEVESAKEAAGKAEDQVRMLKERLQHMETAATSMSEFESDEQSALKSVIQENEHALQESQARITEYESAIAAAETSLNSVRQELDASVQENQQLRVQMELMESAMESQFSDSSTKENTGISETQNNNAENEARIVELEQQVRTYKTEVKLAKANESQARRDYDIVRRFCADKFPTAM